MNQDMVPMPMRLVATPPYHQPTTPMDPNTLDPQTAFRALVFAQGQPALAAERLGLRSADELLAVMVLDETIHDQMRQVMRAFMMVRLLGVANNLEAELMGRIEELEPKDLGKLFTTVVGLADLLTKGAPTSNVNIDVQTTMMRMLPPDVRRAFQVITSNEPVMDDDSTDSTDEAGT